MLLRRTVAATIPPVDLLTAKEHLRVTNTDEDAVISALLAAATGAISEMSGRSLAAETWQCAVPSISGDFTLPKSPVTAVTGITYFDTANVSQTMDTATLNIVLSDDQAVLNLQTGASWPVTTKRPDAITITFTTGYSVIPAELSSAILLMLGHLYVNREATGASMSEIPLGVESLVSLHRMGWAAA